jgi:hypothetical protein
MMTWHRSFPQGLATVHAVELTVAEAAMMVPRLSGFTTQTTQLMPGFSSSWPNFSGCELPGVNRSCKSGEARPSRLSQKTCEVVETAGGLVQAQAAVIAAMARGELTPDEAAAVASVLETQRRALETHDHERRLDELEGQTGKADEGRPEQRGPGQWGPARRGA